MRAATEGSLPPVMPQGNLVEVLGREVRQGSPGELVLESSPSRQRRPPCKTNKEMSDEAADAAARTYLLTWSRGHWKPPQKKAANNCCSGTMQFALMLRGSTNQCTIPIGDCGA